MVIKPNNKISFNPCFSGGRLQHLFYSSVGLYLSPVSILVFLEGDCNTVVDEGTGESPSDVSILVFLEGDCNKVILL